MNIKTTLTIIYVLAAAVSQASAQTAMHHNTAAKPSAGGKIVAYDAKDKRYYSVAWARLHGMHDKGGDLLTLVPLSSLPKDAKESKAMHGAKM